MKWKTFWQVALLIIIAGAIVCVVFPKRPSLNEIFKGKTAKPRDLLTKPSPSFIPDEPRDLLSESTPAGAWFRVDLIKAKIRWGGLSILFIAYALYLIPIKFIIWAVRILKEKI